MCNCNVHGVELFPILVAAIIPFTFFVTYAIAVGLGHIDAEFPYISDTGTEPPESCVFGQLLNIAAVLVGITCYIRYKQLAEHCLYNVHLQRSNNASLFFGLVSSLGVSFVGNFQETSVLPMHLVGAIMTFGLGMVYCWISTTMSWKMYPLLATKCTLYLRQAITIISTVAFILGFVFAGLAEKHYDGSDRRKWGPNDGGYTYHLASTISEWIMAGVFIVYFLTFVPEFKKLSVQMPVVTVDSGHDLNTYTTDRYADDEPMIS